MSARIEVLSGPLAGRTLPISGSSFSIGREAGNDLVLDDGTVSRKHVLIVPDASGAVIRDLGSRNGILLDGKSAREGRLAHGTSFSVGRVACRFLLEAPAGAKAPAAPSVQDVPARKGKKGGEGFDRRFALVLGVSALLVAAVLLLWYRKAHPERPEEVVIILKEGEERYQPFLKGGLQRFEVRELKGEGILKVLKQYKNALSFRAMAQGDADIEVVHEDATRSTLKVSVHGHKETPIGMEIPVEVQGDAAREEEFFRRKMAEAVARAAEGRFRDALVMARATEGYYYGRMPKPRVAQEARDHASQWEAKLRERLDQLEEERRHQSELRNYEKVEKILWSMKELVEDKSAEHQRLQFIRKINQDNLAAGKGR